MRQPIIPPTPSGTCLTGKTVLITGGNSGIGFETARQLLILNSSRVIITARDTAKGNEAVAALRDDPEVKKSNPSALIETFSLDLDDYRSGLRFTQEVREKLPELDVLICSGGVNIMEYQVSKSGHERVMQVNCYTHFVIVLELLSLLRATGLKRRSPSRVTFIGSHYQSHHSLTRSPIGASDSVLEHWDNRNKYSGMQRYADSKFVINIFVRQLATMVPSSEVVINNFCPGFVATSFDKNLPIWIRPVLSLWRKLLARNVQDGGRTAVYATAVAGEETHGKYLESNKVEPGPSYLREKRGEELAGKLWNEILEEVNREDPNFNRSL
ncbi:putative short-chain dehydrogenase [Aspergillus affinis]|uniref:putative short-chain dehydrogenase n=1 Tax=Aspergillus affinis TaxID=1070780 RepID=UPI0022FDB891|nr:putative short-chain dehydrogenase [Aspergillus affinis]KAI9034862.1 putative short-chain dehydrogenase [Aspergillus affinis]